MEGSPTTCPAETSITVVAASKGELEAKIGLSPSCTVHLVIPDSVTTIGEEAFLGCSSLASVSIPDSVTTIGD